jgi:glucose-1-phosphatase
MQVKNIFFDLGAVVLNIDYNGPATMLKDMGVHHFDEFYSKAKQNNLFTDFEKGIVTPSAFRQEFNALTGLNFNDSEIDKVWNTIILDFPKSRLELIKSLRKHYKTFLLSNTNIIHYDFYNARLNKMGYVWDDLFDTVFLSHEMGMRKPEHNIYLKALELANAMPSESVFIDDLLPNTEAAAACGMKGVWLKEGMELTMLFKENRLIDSLTFLQ